MLSEEVTLFEIFCFHSEKESTLKREDGRKFCPFSVDGY